LSHSPRALIGAATGMKRASTVHAVERRFEIVDVLADRGLALVGDRRDAFPDQEVLAMAQRCRLSPVLDLPGGSQSVLT
jgi:hypothetical protein